MSSALIYLDHNATTPCDPRVVEAMLPYFYEKPGNAASRSHPFGWVAEEAVKQARQQVADLLAAEPEEIVFTSGATESDNLALKGIFEAYHLKGNHIITVETEHQAVLDSCAHLEKLGAEVTYLGVDQNGLIDLFELEAAIRSDTILVSIMWANNETGVIQPMEEIGRICHEKNTLLMSDATQAVGKITVHPREAGVHLLAFTAHKMYGPKGIGALYVSKNRPRVKVAAQIDGGGHQNARRSGTLNVPAIVGLGKAAAIAQGEMIANAQHLEQLRNHLEQTLCNDLPEVYVNGGGAPRMSHVSNLSFRFVEAEALLGTFNQQIAVSTGSACSSETLEPSHVLLAMGIKEDLAKTAVRFSLGRETTKEEVEEVIHKVKDGVERLRAESPVWEMFLEGMI